jgi:GDP-L-fucose synthase
VAETLLDRRVLVTGGHGFIGSHVVAALAAAGAAPISVVHPSASSATEPPGVTRVVDLEDLASVQAAVADIDAVVHLAAKAGGIQFQEEGGDGVFAANRRITDNVIAACIAQGVRRVFLASSLVTYRPPESARPFDEQHAQLGPADRPSPYAWSKITDEVVLGWHVGRDLDPVIGRFGNVYGPGSSFEPSRSTVVHALIDRAAKLDDGQDLIVWGDGTAVRSFVFVEDVAAAVVLILADGEEGSVYNVDSGEAVTVAGLASVVRDAVNPSLGLRFDASKPAGIPFRVPSIARLRSIGFEPATSLADGIAHTVAWYRQTQHDTAAPGGR